jgi:hypothetical protein
VSADVNTDAKSRSTACLLAPGSSRIGEALGTWVEEEYDRAAASAPMAVELTGKAGATTPYTVERSRVEVEQTA